MSCNVNFFDTQLTAEEASNISLQEVKSVVSKYVENSLGTNFKSENGVFEVKGTIKPIHNTLVKDVNERFKKELIKEEREGVYSYNLKVFNEIANNSKNLLNQYSEKIENNIEGDISYSPVSQNTTFNVKDSTTFDASIIFEGNNLENYLNFLENLQSEYETRLQQIKQLLKTKTKELTQKEKLKLVQEQKRISQILYGNRITGEKGLKRDIAFLRVPDNQLLLNFESIADNHFKRIQYLIENPTKDNRKEAYFIVQYYKQVGTFNQKSDNPIFSSYEIFDKDGNIALDPELHARILEVCQRFEEFENRIINKEIDDIEEVLKDNPNIDVTDILDVVYKRQEEQQTYERILKKKNKSEKEMNFVAAYEELQKNLEKREFKTQEEKDFHELYHRLFKNEVSKDIDYFSFLLLDVGASFSGDSLITQIMLSNLTKDVDHYDNIIAYFTEELSQRDKIAKAYLRKNKIKKDIFRQRNHKTNQLTGRLVSRFTAEYSTHLQNLNSAIKNAPSSASKASAIENKISWLKDNTTMVDIRKLPEIQAMFSKELRKYDDTVDQYYINDFGKHKQELIDLLGEEGYQEIIKEQERLVEEYISNVRATINNLLFDYKEQDSNITLEELLDNEEIAKEVLLRETIKNPLKQAFNYENNFTSIQTQFLDFVPNSENHYDSNYETIESSKQLKDFYDLVKDMLYQIHESMPFDLQRGHDPMTFGEWVANSREELLNPDTNAYTKFLILSHKFFRDKWHKLSGNFLKQRNDLQLAESLFCEESKLNPTMFFKTHAQTINKEFLLEKIALENKMRSFKEKSIHAKIKKNTVLPYNNFPSQVLQELMEKSGRTAEAFEAEYLENGIPVGKILLDNIIHKIQIHETTDLNKLISYHFAQALTFEIKKESEMKLKLFKQHYFDESRKPGITSTNQFSRLENWENRVIYGNFEKQDLKLAKRVGSKIGLNYLATKKALEIVRPSTLKKDNIFTKKGLRFKRFDAREKELYSKYQKLAQELDPKNFKDGELNEFLNNYYGMGKRFSLATAGGKAVLGFQRWVGLGFHYLSGIQNRTAAFINGQLYDSSGVYWTPGNLTNDTWVMRGSFLRFLSFGLINKIPGIRKLPFVRDAEMLRTVIDRWQIIQDVRNELQQAEDRTLSKKVFGMVLSPYEHIQRVEFINQAPMVLAIMKDTYIYSADKTSKISLRDALDNKGLIKKELRKVFATEENIRNWEQSITSYKSKHIEPFLKFKSKTIDCLKTLHGDYTALGGSVIKSYTTGNAFMMFKGWSPRQFYQVYHDESYNLVLGRKTKGRIYSETKTTATMSGALIGLNHYAMPIATAGMWFSGAVGAGIGILVGTSLAYYMNKRANKFKEGKSSFVKLYPQSQMSILKEMTTILKMVSLKMVGIPTNFVLGKHVIGDNIDMKNFEKMGLDQMDAENLKALTTKIALQVHLMLLEIFMMVFFKNTILNWGDDDDEEEEGEGLGQSSEDKNFFQTVVGNLRKNEALANFLFNNLAGVKGEINMYTEPVQALAFYLDNPLAFYKFASQVDDLQQALQQAIAEPDLGYDFNRKRPTVITRVEKFLPVTFRLLLEDRIGTQYASLERVFEDSPFVFLDKEEREKAQQNILKKRRAVRTQELVEQGLTEKEAKKQVNEELPTEAQQKNKKEADLKKADKAKVKKKEKRKDPRGGGRSTGDSRGK